MYFEQPFLDSISERIPVSSVVGKRVALKKRGREWIGLSPFNPEKTPSFTVNDEKGFYHCFSSGKHGSIFNFLMETEGLTFPEAVERLALEAGLNLPQANPRAREEAHKRHHLIDVTGMANEFFMKSLQEEEGRLAREYLAERGINSKILQEFQIGYAPADRHKMANSLVARQVTMKDMQAAGLTIKPDDGRPPYARFRERIMIPIHNRKGEVIAFGGRILREHQQPKYLNSNETVLFDKSATLFNLHRARQAIHEAGQVIVVEGYMDVIAVFQAGVKNVVATLGTAFTPGQIASLWRLAPEPVICFDGDRAGIGAAFRAMERILPELKSGFSFNFVFLPEGQDPDDLIAQQGIAAFRERVDNAIPFIDVLWMREKQEARFDTPERFAAFEKKILDLCQSIRDERVRNGYVKEIRNRIYHLSRSYSQNTQSRNAPGAYTGHKNSKHISPGAHSSTSDEELLLLALVMARPDLLTKYFESFADLSFNNNDYTALQRRLLLYISEHPEVDFLQIYAQLTDHLQSVVCKIFGAPDSVEQCPGYQIGEKLAQHFPAIRHHPPASFVENYFTFLIERGQFRQIQAELDRLSSSFAEEEDMARIIELGQVVQAKREEIEKRDHIIAERMAEIASHNKGN